MFIQADGMNRAPARAAARFFNHRVGNVVTGDGQRGSAADGVSKHQKDDQVSNVPVIRPRLESLSLAEALQSLAKGDWSPRLPLEGSLADVAVAQAFNTVADLLQTLLSELNRVSEQVGQQGLHGERIRMAAARGAWSQSAGAINGLLDDLLGALAQRMDLDLRVDRLLSQSQNLVTELRSQQESLMRMSQRLATSTAFPPATASPRPVLPRTNAVSSVTRTSNPERKALLVAEEQSTRFRIATALAQRGFRVLVADTGKDGLEMLLANTDAALALIDVDVPHVEGLDTIHIIRGLKEFQSLPIIALGRERGAASDQLPKPINPEQLAALIQAWA